MTDKITIPRHLKPKTRAWFRSVMGDYNLEEHHVKILTLACETWDMAEDARKSLEAQGLTYLDRFGCPKPRPEVGIIAECRITFARLVRELNLDIEPPGEVGRPPRLY